MSAATDKALGLLHAKVATKLGDLIESDECNAAVLGAAITFLKNNNITAAASGNQELDALKEKLANKRHDKTLPQRRALEDAVRAFEALNPDGLPS